MEFVADFHIHSKYSRATSRSMDIPNLAKWAKLKGVNLLGTGDFTHPLWYQELKKYLERDNKSGLYIYQGIYFTPSVEISSIFSQDGKVHRVHNIVLAPSLEVVGEINKMLATFGNIASDGRPILGLSCKKLVEELFKISSDLMLIPAHIWTPWFSVFGSKSGFDSLEDAYGKYTEKITALETGLSSDPAMNWMVSKIDKYALVSNSDAHSPSKIGREANIFNCELSYKEIKHVLETKDKNKFLYTIEFFPEEGKYHYDGHRKCKINFHPSQTKKHQGNCPICKKPLTKGVLSRVEELADRKVGFIPKDAVGYKSMVCLEEIIAGVKGVGKKSKTVEREYEKIIKDNGPEFNILNKMSIEELFSKLPEGVAEGIKKVRDRKIEVIPGHDGEYGIIKIFEKGETKSGQ
ncbi:MAG: DNA helicase UvrD [Candidatus Omnitrophica bacterium]|nr:DNA helicase UvrD [Candidatus Omnitrophota bacterium]